jgi:cellulose synthase/poly-beta-1,6-N-acetylglucosamine synthase-like glycosyltransferase
MLSIIITAYKEPKTIELAIESFVKQKIEGEFEILVVCPDEETKKVVNEISKKNSNVKHVQDPGKGKPVALNIAFKHAKGDILVLTDGDVYSGEDSIKELLKPFEDKRVGAVTGRPISLNDSDTMLGYWSKLLTDAGAHSVRLERDNKNKFIVCSGYLFAIRKVIDKIPEDALADDAVISHMIWNQDYKIKYAPNALVYVKYPTNFNDWVLQKKRSTGGYRQIEQYFGDGPKMRSFWREIVFGWYRALAYPGNVKEFKYTILLLFARLYLWGRVFWDLRVKKESFDDTWKRVESTK